jgi:chromosome segregation ATPase
MTITFLTVLIMILGGIAGFVFIRYQETERLFAETENELRMTKLSETRLQSGLVEVEQKKQFLERKYSQATKAVEMLSSDLQSRVSQNVELQSELDIVLQSLNKEKTQNKELQSHLVKALNECEIREFKDISGTQTQLQEGSSDPEVEIIYPDQNPSVSDNPQDAARSIPTPVID